MVSVRSIDDILLADARQTLIREIEEAVGTRDLATAFAAWLLPDQVQGLRHKALLTDASRVSGAERTYQHVALLGYASQFLTFGKPLVTVLESGLTWLAGRSPIVDGTPMGFSIDPVALLGVSLGTKVLGDTSITAKVAKWLHSCLSARIDGLGCESWQRWLLLAATTDVINENSMANLSMAQMDADVRVALYSKGFLPHASKGQLEQDSIAMLGLVQRERCSKLGIPRAALRLAALDWVKSRQTRLALKGTTIDELCALLRNVPSGLKRWTWEDAPRTKTSKNPRRWDIDNEYHVQNLLWVLLAPIFPELTDEEYMPKLGPVQPRADICVPSLRVIVEAKFLRAKDPPKKMIEEIGTDASVYLPTQSDYDAIIAFIWDDSRRSELHAELVRGLRAIRGVQDAIIVGRPGAMT